MIRVSHGTLKMLRAGRAETITIPGKREPVTVGRDYALLAVATSEFKREKLRAMVVACERHGTGWRVTFRYGLAPEQPRFLKARPGGMEGDYTTHVSKAIPDEPEPVDATTLTRFEKDARSAERVRRDYETREACRQLEGAIGELASRSDLGDAARRRLANMRRELVRLERELRVA